MGLFNFLASSKPVNGAEVPAQAVSAPPAAIPENVFIEKEAPAKETGIEMLHRFLDRNLESQGYDDALINPDSLHMEENMTALRNEFERTVRRVRQFYADFIREIDFHIESRSRKGMVDLVEELKMKKAIAETHIVRINEIAADAAANTGEYRGILISYERGFKNGLSAITHHHIFNKKI